MLRSSSKKQKGAHQQKSKLKNVLKITQTKEESSSDVEEIEEKVPAPISTEGHSPAETLRMSFLAKTFTGTKNDAALFLDHCRSFMTAANLTNAEVLTVEQADTPLWHQLRVGRITASRIHQASRCGTKTGSLYDSIMGRSRGWSFAMQRGTNLEDQVFKIVQRQMAAKGIKVRQVGLILDSSMPHFGASPDGLADDFTLEIKCPMNSNTHEKYTNYDKIDPKYKAQIQLQMHISKRKKAILAVADVNFEKNKRVTQVEIDYDEEYVNQLIQDAEKFWTEAIFPGLLREHRR